MAWLGLAWQAWKSSVWSFLFGDRRLQQGRNKETVGRFLALSA
jgi:hypothetical protein